MVAYENGALFFAMKISGVLAKEKSYAGHSIRTIHGGRLAPRVWVVVVDAHGAGIWMKTRDGFDRIGEAQFQKPIEAASEYMDHLSEWLEQAMAENMFDRIVLMASADMVEELRKGLSTGVRACIAAEIVKDFSGLKPADISRELSRMIML